MIQLYSSDAQMNQSDVLLSLSFCQWFSSLLTGSILCGGVGLFLSPCFLPGSELPSALDTKPVLWEMLDNLSFLPVVNREL